MTYADLESKIANMPIADKLKPALVFMGGIIATEVVELKSDYRFPINGSGPVMLTTAAKE